MTPDDPEFATWRKFALSLNARNVTPLLQVDGGIEPGTMHECASLEAAERLGVDAGALRVARGLWGAGYEGVVLFVRRAINDDGL